MTTPDVEHAGSASGSVGPPGRAPRAWPRDAAVSHPQARAGRGHLGRGPRDDRAQRRHAARGGRHRDRQLPRGDRDLPRRPAPTSTATRVRFPRGLCRSIVHGDGAAHLHPAGAQRGPQRGHRRSAHGPRAHLRLAVHPQPRRRPALRDDRGLPQLREADVHQPDAPPRRRDAVRAGRPAGQQAPLRHGLQPHPVLGPGVHGLGHASEPGPGLGRHGAHRVRRRGHGARARDHGPGQRQLARCRGTSTCSARPRSTPRPTRSCSSRRSSSAARWPR